MEYSGSFEAPNYYSYHIFKDDSCKVLYMLVEKGRGDSKTFSISITSSQDAILTVGARTTYPITIDRSKLDILRSIFYKKLGKLFLDINSSQESSDISHVLGQYGDPSLIMLNSKSLELTRTEKFGTF